MKSKNYISLAIIFIGTFGLFAISSALTQTNNLTSPSTTTTRVVSTSTNPNTGSTTVGMISTINGKVVTIESKQIERTSNLSATSTPTWKTNVYTVNTSKAIMIIGGSSTSTVANLKVGDMIMVQGIISGKSIAANIVRDIPTIKNSTPPPMTNRAPVSSANKLATNIPKNNQIGNKTAIVINSNATTSSSTETISNNIPTTNTPPVINTPTQKKPGFWSRFISFIVRLFSF